MEKTSFTQDRPDASGVGTAQSRRKSSVNAIALAKVHEQPVDVVENGSLLSDADRRLVEMGYVQVCASFLTTPDRQTNMAM